MEREDIERAADIHANENRNRGNNVKPYSVVDFISGAEWSISSAWHDASETPQHSGMLIAIKQDGTPIVCGPNNSNWKKEAYPFNEETESFIRKKFDMPIPDESKEQ